MPPECCGRRWKLPASRNGLRRAVWRRRRRSWRTTENGAINCLRPPARLGPAGSLDWVLSGSVGRKSGTTEGPVLLRQSIKGRLEAGGIPSGHKLAYECLLAVCGTKTISIRILKPEYHLSPVPREITELVK